MAIFDTFGISGSGLMTHRKWLDAVSDNIANVNTVRRTDEDAFQQRMVVAEAVEYGTGEGGVRVARAEFGSAEGRLVYQPDHPLADADGNVRMPDIDLGSQMSQLIMAQRGFQAQSSVIKNAQDVYSSALAIGRNS